MRRWIGVIAVAALAVGCAEVQQFTIRDLRAAQARAERANDATWAKCMKALGDHVEAQASQDRVPPVGIADAVTAAHLLYAKSQQGVPSQFKADCAEVALELIVFAARTGIKAFSPF